MRKALVSAAITVVVVSAVISFVAVPGATHEPLACHDGQMGAVMLTLFEGGSGAPTPVAAAENAENIVPRTLLHSEVEIVGSIDEELFQGVAEDLDIAIKVTKLADGYAIEAIHYCYTGPLRGPIHIDELESLEEEAPA